MAEVDNADVHDVRVRILNLVVDGGCNSMAPVGTKSPNNNVCVTAWFVPFVKWFPVPRTM
jgi:hypothetical protein